MIDNTLFTVRFHRKDNKPVEEYVYFNLNDAEYHFNLFHDDDSGLYTHIDLTETRDGFEKILQTQINPKE